MKRKKKIILTVITVMLIALALCFLYMRLERFVIQSYCGVACYTHSMKQSKEMGFFISKYNIDEENKFIRVNDSITFSIDEIYLEHSWNGDKNNDCKPKRVYINSDSFLLCKPYFHVYQLIVNGSGIDRAFIRPKQLVKISTLFDYTCENTTNEESSFSPISSERIAARLPLIDIPDSLKIRINMCKYRDYNSYDDCTISFWIYKANNSP